MSMQEWVDICEAGDITPGVGVCALHEGQQVAIFVERISKQAYAIGNYDPIGKANVLSRGLTGCINGEIVVASPLYKQHFVLATGQCLEQPEISVPTYAVRIAEGKVQLAKSGA